MTRKALVISTIGMVAIIAVYLVATFVADSSKKTSDPQVVQYTGVTQNIAQSDLPGDSVPLPTEEDIIRLFFTLINEKRIPEAIQMMSSKVTVDDSQKQAWGVQFNAFSKVAVISVSAEGEGLYRVVLEAEMNPNSADEIIPYFGYENGENVRWISLENIDGGYKISGIATGR